MSFNSSLSDKEKDSGDLHVERVNPNVVLEKPDVEFNQAEEDALHRRMDWRIMPILALLYLMSFLDRGNIGNARLYGLEGDLGMLGTNQFNIALSVFFLTYCAFEVPANLMLKLLRPAQWLALITVAWGTVMTCMGFVQSFGGLVAARLILGICEAGLFPGVTFLLTVFYPRHKTQFRIALFFSAATAAGSLSGILAYAIGFMNGVAGYNAWRWIFILEGAATILCGFLAYFTIVDSIASAKFLTPEEREWLVYRKSLDSGSAGEAAEVSRQFIVAALTNWQVWLSTAYYMSIVVPTYSIGFFLPTIIRSFGTYTLAQVQLLTIPPYIVACVHVLVCAYYADKYKTRYYFIVGNQLLCVVGFILNIIEQSPQPLKYVGLIFITMGAYASVPTCVTWLANNLSGQTKRGIGMAFQIGVGNLGALASSNIYRTMDAPRYYLGHGTCLAALAMGLVTAPLYAYLLTEENNKRAAYREHQLSLPIEYRRVYNVKELHELGDNAPDFVYTV